MTTAEKEMAETLKHNGQSTPLARGSSHGSADPQHHNNGTALFRHSTESGRLEKEYEAGCLPEQVYDHALSPWRAAVRRVLVASLRKESELMGRIQVSAVAVVVVVLSFIYIWHVMTASTPVEVSRPLLLLDGHLWQQVFSIQNHSRFVSLVVLTSILTQQHTHSSWPSFPCSFGLPMIITPEGWFHIVLVIKHRHMS